jgi:ferric-dicitrate binding protein FerR (iron transport regulator)
VTRAEELVLKRADAGLDAAEEAELDGLLADPETAARCLELAEIEAALRAERIDGALPDAVLAAVSRRRDEETERAVMERIRAGRRAPMEPHRRQVLLVASLAAGVLVAVALAAFREPPPPSIGRVEGGPGFRGFVVRGDRELVALPGFALRAGDGFRSGAGSVEFAVDGVARVRLEPYSELALTDVRRIELRQGEISADVLPQPPGRPLVISAPHARAEVLGTRLTMSAAADATRLEVRTGSVRLVRADDGAELLVRGREYSVACEDVAFDVRPVAAAPEERLEVTGFSLITLDAPRQPIPGYEDLKNGAVIRLSELPTRRINLRANTRPSKVGSLRFSTPERENFNTELVAPYTIVPGNGIKGRAWNPEPGRHEVTATPFSGSYGNGERGSSRTVTFTLVDDR